MDIERILSQTFVARAEHHETIDSTNNLLRRYAEGGSDSSLPLLIVADRQTAGRGRGAKRWWSATGGLTFSLLFAADLFAAAQDRPPLAGLASAVAVAETVAPLLPRQNVAIHWPNDVYAGGRKICGILVEVLADRRHIIGIGLNVNNSTSNAPAEIGQRVATLCELAGRKFDVDEILIDILQRLERHLLTMAESPEKVARATDCLCGQKGSELVLKLGTKTVAGRCLGIADDGGLKLQTQKGLQVFHSGSTSRD